MIVAGREFKSVWLVESLDSKQAGCIPQPVCANAMDLVTGQTMNIWLYDNGEPPGSPFPCGDEAVLVSSALIPVAIGFLTSGWPLPIHTLDLSAEFRVLTNGQPHCEATREGILRYFGDSVLTGVDRLDMENLLFRGGSYTETERNDLNFYCRRRLSVTKKLFDHLFPHFDGPRSFFRGRYLLAAARVEMTGIPVDSSALAHLYENRERMKQELIDIHGRDFPEVFVNGRFDETGFRSWLSSRSVRWPRTSTGLLMTDDDTLKDMALLLPELEPVRQLKKMLNHLGSHRVAVGPDGRNRCPTCPFASVTGRNQPPNGQWIFGAPRWMRKFIRPEPGWAIAMIDYKCQEFAIAAALSGDQAMAAAYNSSDPYMAFAIASQAAPVGASAATHPQVRSHYKIALISIMYGIGIENLAIRLGVSTCKAERLMRDFRGIYRVFDSWQQAVIEQAYLDGFIQTSLGWRMAVNRHTNPKTLGNFPLQATGGDLLRLAVCLCQEQNISISAMVHDALLIECPVEELEVTVAAAKNVMHNASRLLLDGFEVLTDPKTAINPFSTALTTIHRISLSH